MPDDNKAALIARYPSMFAAFIRQWRLIGQIRQVAEFRNIERVVQHQLCTWVKQGYAMSYEDAVRDLELAAASRAADLASGSG